MEIVIAALVAGVVASVAIPIAAAFGKGYRGAYFGFAIAAFLVAIFFYSILANNFNNSPTAEVRKAQPFNTLATVMVPLSVGIGLGCVMGGAFYRRRKDPETQFVASPIPNGTQPVGASRVSRLGMGVAAVVIAAAVYVWSNGYSDVEPGHSGGSGDSRVASSSALTQFDDALARFKVKKPLIEIDADGVVHRVRDTASLPTATTKAISLVAMSWNPDDGRIVNLKLPLWILAMGRKEVELGAGADSFDLRRLNLDIKEMERVGSLVVVDGLSPSGSRLLVWTE